MIQKTILAIVAFFLLIPQVQAQSCSGTRSTPVRNVLRGVARVAVAPAKFVATHKPVRSTLAKLVRPASTCSGTSAAATTCPCGCHSSPASGAAVADTKGAYHYAAYLDSTGSFAHDQNYVGVENLYRSQGVATPEQAVQYWQTSAGHRQNLPYITTIKCVNGTCVGR